MLPTPRRRLALAVVPLALLAPLLALAPAASSDDARPETAGAQVRIATFNINARTSNKKWRRGVTALRRDADVIALQEVAGSSKKNFLERRRGAFAGCAKHPRKAGVIQTAVTWRTSVFAGQGCRFAKVAGPQKVERTGPGARARVPSKWVTVARLEHRATGREISVVSVHVGGGGVSVGRKVKGRPKLYQWYTRQVAGIVDVVRSERASGRSPDVVVLGDFNNNYPSDRKYRKSKLAYAQLTRQGLQAAWEARGELKPGQGSGSRGGSYLDQIWFDDAATGVAVLKKKPYRISDHFPVVGRYAF